MANSVMTLLSRLPRSGVWAATILAGLVVALGMVKYGLGFYSGASNLFAVTQNPWDPGLDPSQDFVLRNATFVFLLGILGVTNSTVWIAIHVILAIAALALPFFFPTVRESPSTLRLLLLVMIGGPVVPVILGWIGAYDAFAVIGLAAAALARSRGAQIAGWFIVGFTHAELGLAAAGVLMLYQAFSKTRGMRATAVLRTAAVSLPPLVVWLVLTTMLVQSWGGSTSRLLLALANPGEKLYRFELVMPAMLFSILGVTWLFLLRRDTLRSRSGKVLALMSVALGLTVPFVLEDYTRVLGLLTFPLVLTWLLGLGRELQDRLWRTFAVAAVIIPIPVFIAGTVGFGGVITFLTWRTVTQI